MNFHLDADQTAFQQEVVDFIEQGLPDGWDSEHESFAEALRIERQIMTRLAAKHWLALPWPKEFGGLGASPMQQLIFNEQMAYHGVPGTMNMGVAWVGPVVMLYGRDDQKAQYLSRIADGSDLWCTLYSEPGAGSDLAAMQTRAVRDGDDYIINGQKIWTSFGHYADWGWLAVRTDPDVPKHKGLSTFAIKMDTPGITIRPLVNMAGTHEFNEIFFEDVRVPAANLVGEENRGWYNVAVGLDFERSSIGATSNSRRMVDDLVTYLRTEKPRIDNAVKHRLVDEAIGVALLRNMAYYIASRQEKTGIAPTREAQMAKLFGAELQQRIAATALQVFGMEGQAHRPVSRAASYRYGLLRSVANTIEGGTSEIQRSVIATRGLGLPRE
ncbi:acyl-CoA dehydrogenase family protein [Candidatus Amarobacter glycogenicus]|uniref:acyl-CoA dehydrogenase family protein n=1 Tax=Candidatus Amarobacter glycogenicus TaxID=3140699 RepID=UPI0031350325|nr:acyl-CoA dehydrogenase family protein [Dehalococcoidia bacterium]MBK8559652.1 acyl-CoA dehydrogenase family protein [Dehalococcoidia bacterium]MCC6268623.1 acyl-CoA dehydrogenase family protein [Dehalococcoidia bacterium]